MDTFLKTFTTFVYNLYSCLIGWIGFGTLLCLNACTTPKSSNESIAFYYWKTHYHLNSFERAYLQKQDVQKIYLHCFDIALENGQPKPQGVLLWQEAALKGIEYIPTVFIQNEILQKADTSHLHELAQHTFSLCKQILAAQQLSIKELQIDCDWTESTRDSYFYFLKCLKQNNITLSTTLRLYQYKYATKSGIPPADYVSLMCYNMGNMKKAQNENSILNKNDLQAYLQSAKAYPLPLNIALPIFNWTLLYSNQTFKGILYQVPDLQNRYWKRISEISYICVQAHFDSICQQNFYPNESIRMETISKKDLEQALLTIQHYVNNSKNEIIYFDLDSSKIRHCLY